MRDPLLHVRVPGLYGQGVQHIVPSRSSSVNAPGKMQKFSSLSIPQNYGLINLPYTRLCVLVMRSLLQRVRMYAQQ